MRIEIEELPARTRRLNLEDLRNVFGSCYEDGEGCNKPEDCCSGNCFVYHFWSSCADNTDSNATII